MNGNKAQTLTSHEIKLPFFSPFYAVCKPCAISHRSKMAQVYVHATGNAWSGLEELQGAWRHPWGDQLLGSDGKPP